jgi:hypothetical protein
MPGHASDLPLNPLTQRPYAQNVGAVYPGCEAPPAPGGGAIYYSDPVAGSNRNDGSRAHPFASLHQMVADGMFANDPFHPGSGVIKAGATIYLLPGNHGDVRFQGWHGVSSKLDGLDFASWVTIAGEPGNPYAAVLTGLQVWAGKMAFRNFSLRSLNTSGSFTTASSGRPEGAWLVQNNRYSHDTFFDHLRLNSADDAAVNAWSMSDWQARRSSGISDGQSACTSVTNNTLRNVGFGIATQDTSKVLVAGNTINRYADDGIDWGSSDLRIVNNDITNSINDADGFHRDVAQGQPGNKGGGSNIEIDHNTGIRITDPGMRTSCSDAFHLHMCPGTEQGIDTFDGVWSNLNIHDNVVVVNEGQALAFYGVDKLSVTNNFAGGDDGFVVLCGVNDDTIAACGNPKAGIPRNGEPGLTVYRSKTGRGSSNVTISGNYVANFTIDNRTTAWRGANNHLWITNNNQTLLAYPASEGAESDTFTGTPGTYPTAGVTLEGKGPARFIRKYDVPNASYDFRLLP